MSRDRTCPRCGHSAAEEELRENLYQCGQCGYLFAMPPAERIRLFSGKPEMQEFLAGLTSRDPLGFPGYREKLAEESASAMTSEAVVTGVTSLRGIRTALAVMNPAFLMGSMGTVVGEKIAHLAEYAGRNNLPLVIVTASGGARMQEGLFSLMQMAKTAAAVERFKSSGNLFVTLLTNPTSGGVTASFGMLGDIILAEPEALICFTGPRIVEQTIGRPLPEGSQRAEYLLARGMVDGICERKEQQDLLYRILTLHGYGVETEKTT